MKTTVRVAAFAALAFTLHAGQILWLTCPQPELSAAHALRQLNGNDDDARELRWFQAKAHAFADTSDLLLLTVGLLLFLEPLRRLWSSARPHARALLPLLCAGTLLSGCRPYDTPEFNTIDTAETGFLIPMEGDTQQQVKFASEAYLRQLKVAAKRVQITHRWQQTGRTGIQGEWLPTVKLVKVQRSPVTREWTADPNSGTSKKNEAIWIESADSVAFSLGFTCTAFIAEEDAARFLYWYPSGSLEKVMDSEMRGRIQQVGAEIAAKYTLDDLRARKQEIMDAVRKDVTTFFAERGITVSTAGMFGGMTYENPDIQKAIDKTFIAQQEKVVNQARFEAQQRENDRVSLEASATAEQARRKAEGEADAKKLIASAEAESIREVTKALAETPQNSLLLQLKQIDVEKARVEKWTGAYPQYFLAPSDKAALLLQLPAMK